MILERVLLVLIASLCVTYSCYTLSYIPIICFMSFILLRLNLWMVWAAAVTLQKCYHDSPAESPTQLSINTVIDWSVCPHFTLTVTGRTPLHHTLYSAHSVANTFKKKERSTRYFIWFISPGWRRVGGGGGVIACMFISISQIQSSVSEPVLLH